MNSDQTCSEPKHRRLLDALSDAVILIDPINFRIIDANRKARELIGLPMDASPLTCLATDILASSPIGRIDQLEAMLTRGEGSIVVSRERGNFIVEVCSFTDSGVDTVMLTVRTADDGGREHIELGQVRKEHQALLDMITDMVFSVDRSGRVVSVNHAIRSLGYREEEIIGANVSKFIVASHWNEASTLLNSTFSGGRGQKAYSIEVLSKDGEVHLMLVRGHLVKIDGAPAEVQCIARDITPLVEADKALGESLWQYKSLFEHAHIAMWEIEAFDALLLAKDIERETGRSIQEAISKDPQIMIQFLESLRFVDVNTECLDLFKARSKEELFEDHSTLFSEESLPMLSGLVGSMLVGNSGASFECVIKTLKGEERSVVLRWGSLQSHRDGHRRMLLSFIDTTEKVRVFRRLEAEKRFGDAIIDFAESLIIGTDMEGTIIIFNRKAEQATGLTREEVLGKNYFTLFDPEVSPEGGRAWLSEMARAKGSVERIKVLPVKNSNPLIWWHNTVVQSGDRLVMISLGVDITERVSLNHRMEDLNNSLLLLNRIMRHDIMNDLSVALGSIQLYEMKRESRFLEAATRSLTKSVDLIHDISDLEKLRAPTELRSVKVRETIDKVVANRAGQNVLIRVTGDATAMADERLSSVLDNLVGNAIMHGHTEAVNIDVSTEDGHCVIRVADHGKGIPDEIKDRIFEEGFKFGETGNTGFGLYIVKKTMERYGGSVTLKDNHPSGAVFELRLLLSPSR